MYVDDTRYLESIALRLGCPRMWLDDCVQEQRIGIWLTPHISPRLVARRRAIDFLRSVGEEWRTSKPPEALSLDAPPDATPDMPLHETLHTTDQFDHVNEALNYFFVWKGLTPQQRRVLSGETKVSYGRLSQVRKLARARAA